MKSVDDSALRAHKFIIFCGDHYNPLGVVRSLGEMKIRPIVILVAEDPFLVPRSKYIQTIHRVADMEAGLEVLLRMYGNEKEKPFVYTCSDEIASLLDLNYDRLIDKFYFFHGKQQGTITKYLDKKTIADLAVKCGCKALKYEVVETGQLPRDLTYPVITKAVDSTLYDWKREMHICQNEAELLEAYKTMRGDHVLIQEYIHKKNEYCVDGFSYNDGEDMVITYVANYPRFTDICYGAYMIMHPLDRMEVYDQLKDIIKEMGFAGIFCAEFLIDENNDLYFLEVNLRNSGWSYASTYGGYNMPYLWAKATLEKQLDLGGITKREKFTAMSEFEDFHMFVSTKQLSFFPWFKDYITTDCHFITDWRDPRPLFFMLRRFVTNRIKRLLRRAE